MNPLKASKSLGELAAELQSSGLRATLSAGAERVVLRADTLKTDTRRLHQGDTFLAYRGVTSDSHDRLDEALQRGAQALIVEREDVFHRYTAQGIACLLVDHARKAWAHLCAALYDHPERLLRFVGVTGTNGKTSTVWMTRELLAAEGIATLSLGTLGAMFGPRVEPTNHTTPDPDVLFALLRRAVNEQITTVLMEVSSIALAQERLAPLKFDAVAFTSFSRDHLDFHGSMEEYLAQKLRLFSEHLKLGARIALSRPLVNLAAKSSPAHSTDRWSYDGQAHSATAGFQGVHYSLREASSNGAVYSLHRGVNVLTGRGPFLSALAWENFTAALLLSEAILGRTPDPRHWANLEAVPGRLERVRSARDTDVDVIVDYAHTPDALEKTLAELRPLTRGKLWCVFGCGGDRDRGKRPEMGLIAGRLADHVLLTSDNPRSEDPQSILDEIARGLDQRPFLSFVDRRAAITHAVHHATTGDVVLIAGKGHETYQMIGTNRVPFDDRLEARHALETRP